MCDYNALVIDPREFRARVVDLLKRLSLDTARSRQPRQSIDYLESVDLRYQNEKILVEGAERRGGARLDGEL